MRIRCGGYTMRIPHRGYLPEYSVLPHGKNLHLSDGKLNGYACFYIFYHCVWYFIIASFSPHMRSASDFVYRLVIYGSDEVWFDNRIWIGFPLHLCTWSYFTTWRLRIYILCCCFQHVGSRAERRIFCDSYSCSYYLYVYRAVLIYFSLCYCRFIVPRASFNL